MTDLSPLPAFVGRTAETDWLLQRLRGEAGVVTLTGIGGIGKTRLARHVAEQVAMQGFRDVNVVELAALSSDADAIAALADALGVYGTPASLDVIVDCRRDRRVLVVLDNCEHRPTRQGRSLAR
jgi:predicted ATPase